MDDEYKQLIDYCYYCINTGDIKSAKALYGNILSANNLTTAQKQYIINKVESFIFCFYDSLSDHSFYSSLNNDKRSDVSVITKVCICVI